MKSRQANSETKYTRRPILPEIEFVNLPLVEFHSSISAHAGARPMRGHVWHSVQTENKSQHRLLC